MGDLGQSLPPDTGDKLANLELGAEQAVASLGEAEQEHKRARTVRYDFQVRIVFHSPQQRCFSEFIELNSTNGRAVKATHLEDFRASNRSSVLGMHDARCYNLFSIELFPG